MGFSHQGPSWSSLFGRERAAAFPGGFLCHQLVCAQRLVYSAGASRWGLGGGGGHHGRSYGPALFACSCAGRGVWDGMGVSHQGPSWSSLLGRERGLWPFLVAFFVISSCQQAAARANGGVWLSRLRGVAALTCSLASSQRLCAVKHTHEGVSGLSCPCSATLGWVAMMRHGPSQAAAPLLVQGLGHAVCWGLGSHSHSEAATDALEAACVVFRGGRAESWRRFLGRSNAHECGLALVRRTHNKGRGQIRAPCAPGHCQQPERSRDTVLG